MSNSQTSTTTITATQVTRKANGATRLTVTHELAAAPTTAVFVAGDAPGGAGGGWPFILSDLKTLLETGTTMAG